MSFDREQQLLAEIARLKQENELLRQKLDLVLRKLFGKSSEQLDPAQLELLLDPPGKAPASLPPNDAPEEEAAAPNAVASPEPSSPKPRRPRLSEHLPVVEETLLPEAVKACPDAWRRIGEEHSDRLDYQPARIFIHRLIRPVFVRTTDRDAAPVTAKLPPRLQDGLTATPGLIAHVLVAKYCDHLPFYRQEKILATRHGASIGRNTLCRWTELAAFWLKPIYQSIHRNLLASDYLQGDETPVKYLAPGTGKTAQGYLWVLHRPGGNVFYQWHPSRRHACLDDLLGNFTGTLQSDGYAAYQAHSAKHPGIKPAACWAHARRKFHEALQTGQVLAAAPLKAIGQLYCIEKELRQTRAGPDERTRARQTHIAPVLHTLRHDLTVLRGHSAVLPKSPLGRAIDYTLGLWPKLETFLHDGQIEPDNNLIENAIRPTAVGKKNWLFIGGEDTGERSAILYTLIESAKRHGHEPYAYLKDLLDRLPCMTNRQLDSLLPENWQPPASITSPSVAAK
ncbi:MAG: IS66 family transposase [Luteolibacter sp.]